MEVSFHLKFFGHSIESFSERGNIFFIEIGVRHQNICECFHVSQEVFCNVGSPNIIVNADTLLPKHLDDGWLRCSGHSRYRTTRNRALSSTQLILNAGQECRKRLRLSHIKNYMILANQPCKEKPRQRNLDVLR